MICGHCSPGDTTVEHVPMFRTDIGVLPVRK